MDEYVGKICPYCKTEIKEGEDVKVCPECGIPHHAACWEENKGCTTFGCKEQHYEEQHTNPTDLLYCSSKCALHWFFFHSKVQNAKITAAYDRENMTM